MTTSLLRITDGTTTKNFSSGDNMTLISFEPKSSLDGEPITEMAAVHLTGTANTNRASIQAIERLFMQAENYQRTQTGEKVYIEFDPGSSGTYWRGLLIGPPKGSSGVTLSDETLGWQYDTRMMVTIEWLRVGDGWEGALTQLPLSNTSASNNFTGITVTNRNDLGTVQVETATVVGPIDPAGAGNADFVLTATGMTGTPITTSVAVANDDTATQVATKAATALNLDSDITDRFNIASSGATLIATRLVPAANDTALNIAFDNDTCSGLTPDATSANTTAGSITPHENWVTLRDIDIEGDLPAPIKLEMYNSKSGSDAADEVYVHHNVYSTPASLDHILEGEDATGGTVTDTASGTSSGGLYGSLAWTATTETLIATWALSTTELSYMAGGRFGILARWVTAFPYDGDTWLRLKLTAATTLSVLWEGNLSIIPNNDRGLHLLDVLRLPPYLAGQAALKGINLSLYATRAESGTHTIPLDYLQLSPISGDDGWKRFLSVETGSAGVAYQEYLTHDDTEGWTYRTDTSAKIISEFMEFGGPILLVPNVGQKLQFLSVDFNGLAKVDQSWTVKLWYRPRRNTL